MVLQTNPFLGVGWSADDGPRRIEATVPGEPHIHILSTWCLKLLVFCSQPRDDATIVDFLTQVAPTEDPGEVVSTLHKKGFLVEPASLDPYAWWLKSGWIEGLRYDLACRNIEFADESDPRGDRRESILAKQLASIGPPSPPKAYPRAPRISLPEPDLPGGRASDILLGRKTSRDFAQRPIPREVFAGSLFHGTSRAREARRAATRPDASSALPLLRSYGCAIEIYAFVHRVEGIDPGLYHYDIDGNTLERLGSGDTHQAVASFARSSCGPGILNAGAHFLFTAEWGRYQWRYQHPRAYRMLMITGAQLVQDIVWCATAYGLKNFVSPAILDGAADHQLQLDGWHEGSFYELALGV